MHSAWEKKKKTLFSLLLELKAAAGPLTAGRVAESN